MIDRPRLAVREVRCIHNDRHDEESIRNFSLRGLFGAVIWIALWSLIITAAVSEDARNRYRAVQAGVAR